MSKADSVANATAAFSTAQAVTPVDQAAVDAATAALAAANALPEDIPATPTPSAYSGVERRVASLPHPEPERRGHDAALANLNVMDVAKADVDVHAAAVVAATEIHNVALELNHAIVGNQPQAARSLRARYDELLAKLEGK